MKTSDFKKESDLKSMKVGEIRAHVRTFNDDYAIKGYSKLKKADLISAITKAQLRIAKEKKPKLKVVGAKKPVGTHKMPDGTVMTGKTHSPSSVPVKKPASAKKPAAKKPAAKKSPLNEKQKKSLLEDILREAEEYQYIDYVDNPGRYIFSDEDEYSKKQRVRDEKRAEKLRKLVDTFFKTKKTPKFNAYFKKLIADGKADDLWNGDFVTNEGEAAAREVENTVVQFGDEGGKGIKDFIAIAKKYEANF